MFYAPYEPTRTMFYETSWQANDPLVHYTVGDLISPAQATNRVQVDIEGLASTVNNLGRLNGRYQPWGTPPGQTYSGNVQDTYNLALKDPLDHKVQRLGFPDLQIAESRLARARPPRHALADNLPEIHSGQLSHWLQWSGDIQIATNWGQITTSLVNLFRHEPVV